MFQASDATVKVEDKKTEDTIPDDLIVEESTNPVLTIKVTTACDNEIELKIQI